MARYLPSETTLNENKLPKQCGCLHFMYLTTTLPIVVLLLTVNRECLPTKAHIGHSVLYETYFTLLNFATYNLYLIKSFTFISPPFRRHTDQ